MTEESRIKVRLKNVFVNAFFVLGHLDRWSLSPTEVNTPTSMQDV